MPHGKICYLEIPPNRAEVLVRESDEEEARALLTTADAGDFQLGEDEDVES